MDQNLNNERIVGFLGQSYVLIPRKVLEMLFRGEGRERSVGMVYLALFSEVFFKDGKVFLNKRYYVCKRGEFVGQCEELAKRCGMYENSEPKSCLVARKGFDRTEAT